MFQRIISFVVTVAGVLLALLIGFWTLLSLAVLAAGAALVFTLRSRSWGRARKRHRDSVIEGEFSVVDEAESGEQEKKTHPDSRHLP